MDGKLELGPVLEEPCGYFYRLGVRRGLAAASGARLEKVRGEISARMRGFTAGLGPYTAKELERQVLNEECEALALRLDSAEERLFEALLLTDYQAALLVRVLEGDKTEREAAARYVERWRIARVLGREALGETTDLTESTDGEGGAEG